MSTVSDSAAVQPLGEGPNLRTSAGADAGPVDHTAEATGPATIPYSEIVAVRRRFKEASRPPIDNEEAMIQAALDAVFDLKRQVGHGPVDTNAPPPAA